MIINRFMPPRAFGRMLPLLFVGGLLLAGCGQKGDLFIPDPEPVTASGQEQQDG